MCNEIQNPSSVWAESQTIFGPWLEQDIANVLESLPLNRVKKATPEFLGKFLGGILRRKGWVFEEPRAQGLVDGAPLKEAFYGARYQDERALSDSELETDIAESIMDVTQSFAAIADDVITGLVASAWGFFPPRDIILKAFAAAQTRERAEERMRDA